MKPYLFTSTALPRPELFARTIDSFKTNLTGVDWKESTLIINVDPLPAFFNGGTIFSHLEEDGVYKLIDDQWHDTETLLGIACKTFGRVVTRIWDEDFRKTAQLHYISGLRCTAPCWSFGGNFPRAVQWVFEKASKMTEHEFVFHLEDDWEMVEENSIDMLATGIRASGMMQAALLPTGMTRSHNQFVLCPSLICREAVEMAAAILKADGGNPEEQLRRFSMFRVNTYFVPSEGSAQVIDLGTDWRQAHGYLKDPPDFTTYAKVTPYAKEGNQTVVSK
ncbi:MAG: hypothetical protein ACREJO_00085 [Phycisphaerales bacterium]